MATHVKYTLISLLEKQTWIMEIFLAVQAFSWGIWVGWPFSDAFTVVPGAYALLTVLPEWFIGSIFALHGTAHLYALIKHDFKVRAHAALASTLLWSTVLVNFILVLPGATATPIYACSVMASAWVYLRLSWVRADPRA